MELYFSLVCVTILIDVIILKEGRLSNKTIHNKDWDIICCVRKKYDGKARICRSTQLVQQFDLLCNTTLKNLLYFIKNQDTGKKQVRQLKKKKDVQMIKYKMTIWLCHNIKLLEEYYPPTVNVQRELSEPLGATLSKKIFHPHILQYVCT